MSSQSDRPTDTDSSDRTSATDERPPPAQERGPQRRESVMDSLSRPSVQNRLKYTIGLFGLIGLGFGLTGFLFIELGGGSNFGPQFTAGVIGVILLSMALFIGPVIAGFTGLHIAEKLHADARTVYLTSAIGNFVGYFVMVLVTVLLMAATGGATTGSGTTDGGSVVIFDLGALLVPMLALAIPVALVGAGTTYLHRRFNTP